jgi:hypothetical protein
VYHILDAELAGHLDSVPHLLVQEPDNLLTVALIVGHFLNGRNAFKVGQREYSVEGITGYGRLGRETVSAKISHIQMFSSRKGGGGRSGLALPFAHRWR